MSLMCECSHHWGPPRCIGCRRVPADLPGPEMTLESSPGGSGQYGIASEMTSRQGPGLPGVTALRGAQPFRAGEHHERLGTLADEKEAAHLLLWDLECADYEAWAAGQFELASVALAGFDVIPIPHLAAA